MDKSDEYKLGELSGDVKNLLREFSNIRNQIAEMQKGIEGLKLWRAQVVGMSFAVSLITSTIFSIVIAMGGMVKWK